MGKAWIAVCAAIDKFLTASQMRNGNRSHLPASSAGTPCVSWVVLLVAHLQRRLCIGILGRLSLEI